MKDNRLRQQDEFEWWIEPFGEMRVPAIIYASLPQIEEMDQNVFTQVTNVATLPGIVQASYAMPDAHWGYGFPIGGVGDFDPAQGGVISAGGVGFDISCGVRTMLTGLHVDDILVQQHQLADQLQREIPAGVGSTGFLHLQAREMDEMLTGGAAWAVARGYGYPADLDRIEEYGCAAGAEPSSVSARAKKRQQNQVGTLGSGNHYLEVQEIDRIYDPDSAMALGLRQHEVVVSLHCGSRGLGHQIGTDFLKQMVVQAPAHGLQLPDRELACAPLSSILGRQYLGAMRAGINCALANRQVLTHLVRGVFARFFPAVTLTLLYDVSHNTCKEEEHQVDGERRMLYVHRKGATRAFGPGHPSLPASLQNVGQPVLIGGSMGTFSHIMVGVAGGHERAFSSACHGAGRVMSRRQATKRWRGREIIATLEQQGIAIRSVSMRGIAEEAPGAYKEVGSVVDVAQAAGLARKVARVRPLICIKG
ncbi:MAG: RtcB family protein [Deltaproteobacteria bacterium]|nr:RtcB family protein [Candidatus Anaeroferrophillus wilburensis]MBN2889844.1 RtcB family protein [Deltaproteobacteria bacterium]